ncbi:hypothetical protein AB0D45_06890 [Streptomyces sp. NPDC048352]
MAHLGIPELEQFVEGYVDGWIPDGWITLGPHCPQDCEDDPLY